MRDLVIFAGVFAMLPFCFLRPFFGLLVWSWLGYMNPHKLTWGMAFDFPFVQLAAILTLAGVVVMSFRGELKLSWRWKREGLILIALCLTMLVSTFYALRPDLAWPELERIAKIMLMAFLTMMLLDSEQKLRQLLFVIALSIGFFGFKGAIFSMATGGTHMVFGPPGSSMADNTAIALGMVMAIPILFFLAKSEKHPWLRRGLYVTFFLTCIAVLFTYSRGGALGLAVVVGLISLKLELKYKILAFVLAMLALPYAIQQVPDELIDRVESIQDFEEDGSAQARFGAWKTAWDIGVARPLVGGGFQIVDDIEIGSRFNPDFMPGQGGAHSIYFEILGENGFLALFLFLLLLVSTVLSSRKIRKTGRRSGLPDFMCYGAALEISIVAYAVSGAFLEFASFDLFYQLVAIVIAAKSMLRQKALNETLREPAVADPPLDQAARA